MSDWGNKIKSRLVAAGVKQKDFAKMCGYETTWLCHLLSGNKVSDAARQRIETTLKKIERKKEQA